MRGKQLRFFNSEDSDTPKRRTIIVPLDTIILLSVVFLLLFILFFSLGIEKGRTISYRDAMEEKIKVMPPKEAPNTIALTQAPLKEQILEKKPPPAPVSLMPAAPNKSPSAKEEAVIKPIEVKNTNPKSGYIIQVVTCTKDNFAEVEAKKLQKQGFAAYAAKKNNFVVVYVGPFNDKKQALEQMELLKKTYKDCILRRL